jgi:alkylhydroperoxidase family enzyme
MRKSLSLAIGSVVLCAIGAWADPAAVGTFPLVDRDTNDPIVKPMFDAMKAKNAGPLNIHRTIANAPEVYRGFATFASALRQTGESPRSERELVILRTTQLKGGDYEFAQHRRIGLSCGLTEQQIDGLPDWSSKTIYTDRQRLILQYVDGMLANGTVDDPTMLRVRQVFSPKEIVELTMTSAFYTAVVQFSRAVRVEPEREETTYAGC